MATLKAVRGTRDLLPPETALWNRIEATARSVFARYNFGEIRTPIFEDTSLFARGVGEETDIVSKEMYTWEDVGRFNPNELHHTWLDKHLADREVIEEIGPPYVRPQGLGIEVRRHDGIEIVEFKPSPDSGTAQYLHDRIRSWADPKQKVGARIVVPANVQCDNSTFADLAVQIEQVEGNFFSSQSLTLRPENTAGVVRAYIEHKLGETGQLQKLYYIGPQFRRERPQKGRYRQFSQIGAEVIGPPSAGSESPLRDAEILEMLATLLDEMGITGWILKLNSVGSAADRERYNQVLRAALEPVAAKMCVDCQRRAVTNPLRVLDCKVPEDQPIIDALPKIADSLDRESEKHFAA